MAADKKYNEKITNEDKKILGDKSGNLRNDSGDDKFLKNRKKPIDFEGKDLDVPGRKLPENKSEKTLKDEENQLYSLGGENHEDLEDDADRLK